jgi:hypothetical protein
MKIMHKEEAVVNPLSSCGLEDNAALSGAAETLQPTISDVGFKINVFRSRGNYVTLRA